MSQTIYHQNKDIVKIQKELEYKNTEALRIQPVCHNNND